MVNLGGGETATVDLGVEPEDQVDFTYPFPVNIDVTNIGGPSAGLAMTLGVIDALSPGSLTGDHTVVATGTIDSQGNVGEVGGVPQKTVAVENAGASIFLVPPGTELRAGDVQGPPGAQDLRCVHARPGTGRPGRSRRVGAEGVDGPVGAPGMTGLGD